MSCATGHVHKGGLVLAFAGNPEGVRKALQRSEFDAVVAVSPENVPYIAQTVIETQRGLRERLVIVLWPKGKEPALIVCTIEEPQAREESWIKDIRGYVEFKTSPAALLADVLREQGLAKGRIAIELDYLSASYFRELEAALPDATFVPAKEFFAEVRTIKTPEEIARLEEAAIGTERALLATYATIQAGEPERSMRARLMSNLLLCGADSIPFAYINAGGNAGFPHKLAGPYQCRPGDTVKSDVGGYWNGYVSDVGRTGTIGIPSTKQADIWARLRHVQETTIDQLRPGNTPAAVFETMKAAMASVKLQFPLPHAGHAIGIAVHEDPILNPFDTCELKPNMAFMVESRVRWPNQEGYHMEDLIVVTDGAPRCVTGSIFSAERLFAI